MCRDIEARCQRSSVFARLAGQACGRLARALRTLHRRGKLYLVRLGCGELLAGVVACVIWLSALAVLIYGAAWLLVICLFLLALPALDRFNFAEGDRAIEIYENEELDHRRSVFYHPFDYDDDPDPRFDNG